MHTGRRSGTGAVGPAPLGSVYRFGAHLARIRGIVLLGGTVQVLGVTSVAAGAAPAMGLPAPEAPFLGMIASLSSTAAASLIQAEEHTRGNGTLRPDPRVHASVPGRQGISAQV
jgi:hypothetical protein